MHKPHWLDQKSNRLIETKDKAAASFQFHFTFLIGSILPGMNLLKFFKVNNVIKENDKNLTSNGLFFASEKTNEYFLVAHL